MEMQHKLQIFLAAVCAYDPSKRNCFFDDLKTWVSFQARYPVCLKTGHGQCDSNLHKWQIALSDKYSCG